MVMIPVMVSPMVIMVVFIVVAVMAMAVMVLVAVQVPHVVIVVVHFQDDVEVADVQTGFRHPCDLGPETVEVQGRQRPVESVPVHAQIQHGSHCHVAADPRVAFEVEHPSVHLIAFPSPLGYNKGAIEQSS